MIVTTTTEFKEWLKEHIKAGDKPEKIVTLAVTESGDILVVPWGVQATDIPQLLRMVAQNMEKESQG